MISENNRNSRADIIKGILILCVLFGHSLSMMNSLRGVTWKDSIVNVFLTSFEMPCFTMISGFFLVYSLSHSSPIDVLIKRVIKFFPVLLIWCVLPEIISIALAIIHNESITFIGVLKRLFSIISGGKLWYIFSYLFCTGCLCLYEFFNMKINSSIKKKTYTIASCITLLIFIHISPLSFGHSTFLLPFFVIGFSVGKIKRKCSLSEAKIMMVFSAIFPIILYFYRVEYSFYLFDQNILNACKNHSILSVVLIYISRFVISLVGCCFVFNLSNYLDDKSKIGRVLSNVGRISLQLYILSMYLQEILILLLGVFIKGEILNDYNVLFSFAPVFFILLVLSSLYIKNILNRIPLISKLLLGN